MAQAKWEELRRRMAARGIREADLEESFVRGAGPGGQHRNKSSTCVMLLHRPTGIRVRCDVTRSQADNRFLARRILLERFEERVLGRESEAARERHRIRARKRRRSRLAKERMLRQKRARGELKDLRRPPAWEA